MEILNDQDIVVRLRKRAEIRRSIPTRKSVQAKEPDRIADLLEEAATEIALLRMGGSADQARLERGWQALAACAAKGCIICTGTQGDGR